MPIYEYLCPDCGARYEQLVGLSAPTPACPTCGGANARKLVSAAGFILKGSGWYRDHYGLRSGGSSGEGSTAGAGRTEGAAASTTAPASTTTAPAASTSGSTSGGSST